MGLGAAPAFASTIQLPRTGQTKCYNAGGTEINCAGTGQDGEKLAGIPWPNPRFKDNGDQTQTDTLTGLIWTKDANAPGPSACGPAITKTWQAALDYVKCLNTNNYLSHNDWRLPNVVELESLVNEGQSSPATWLNGQGFSNVQSNSYWSATTSAVSTGYAWYVSMYVGFVDYYDKANSYYVWPVRSGQSGSLGNSVISLPKTGQTKCYNASGTEISCAGTGQDGEFQMGTAWPAPRFTTAGSVVTDNLTGLIWTKDANAPGPAACGPGVGKIWQDALDYVRCLNTNNYLGYNDWRLPNRKELYSLTDFSKSYPSLPAGHPFSNVQSYYYWSSTSYAGNTSYAWYVNMYDGGVDGSNRSYSYYVWPVRSGQVGNLASLVISRTGTGSGTVTSNPAVINCGADCVESYATNGAVVILTATPASGSVFTGWSGSGCSGTGNCTVTVNGDITVNAQFAKLYTLTAAKSGTGTGSITSAPTGINCGSDCTEQYADGTQVVLTASPASGSTFTTWTGDCSGTATTCALTINAAKTVTAYFATQIYTTLSLDLSSQTILYNGTVNITGKLTPLPDTGDQNLSGLTVALTITAPDGSITPKSATTYDSLGHYVIQGLSGFNQKGVYTIKAAFAGTTTMNGSSSDAKALLVGSSAGYAVIVEGKINNNEGLASHNKTANRIYSRLKDRGFADTNIRYFNYDDTQTGVIMAPSKSQIQYAIETWVKSRMNGSPAPLYIIMVDHGNPNQFMINNETITPSDLNTWLTNLESGLTTSASAEKRVVIIGSCYSGSFISTLSKNGRIIITSAAEDEESYKGPNEPDNIRSGEYFLEELFTQLDRGYSIKESFGTAANKTRQFTRQGGLSANTTLNKYLDSSVQHPLLDDTGDGKGSNTLTDGDGDGQTTATVYLGIGTTYNTNSGSNPAEVTAVTDTQYLSASTSSATLWLTANKDSEVSSAWAEVRTPSKVLNQTGSSTGQLEIDNIKELMTLNNTTKRWEVAYNSFTESGMYEIFYFVRDSVTGDISPMQRSVVYKNKSGNTSPAAFNLTSPADGSEQKTILVLDWDDSSDTDGLTYTVLISKDNTFATVDYKKEELTTSTTDIGSDANLIDGTTYYWKVQAIDGYGVITNSPTWSFKTNNTNGLPGIVKGYVRDSANGAAIASATVTIGTSTTKTLTNGYYVMLVSSGTVTIAGTATGYTSTNSTVSVTAGSVTNNNVSLTKQATTSTTVPYDMNGDGKPDILWHNKSTGEVFLWYMNGVTHNNSVSIGNVSDTNWIPIGMGDFNQDGKNDILWHNKATGEVYIWYMNGTTHTGDASVETVSDTNWVPVAVGDFTGDGKPDILWHHKTTGEVYIWTMNGAVHTSGVSVGKVADTNWVPFGTADYNNDGNLDILWHHKVTGDVYVWYMTGVKADKGGASIATVADTNWIPVGTGDYNGDGKPDILWHNNSTGLAYIWYMNGSTHTGDCSVEAVSDTNWKIAGEPSDDNGPQIAVMDTNGDGKPDLVWHNPDSGEVYMWSLSGALHKSTATIETGIPGDWEIAGTGDFNGDGKTDILWHNKNTGEVYVWYMNGSTHTNSVSIGKVSDTNWIPIGMGDFNSDGKNDILWHNKNTGEVYIWYMDGTTHKGDASVETVADPNWTPVAVGDFNGDGKSDILWLNQITGEVYVWYMNGSSHTGSASIEKGVPTDWKITGVGDFNNDGKADILWRNKNTGEVYVWYMNRSVHANSDSLGK